MCNCFSLVKTFAKQKIVYQYSFLPCSYMALSYNVVRLTIIKRLFVISENLKYSYSWLTLFRLGFLGVPQFGQGGWVEKIPNSNYFANKALEGMF